MLRTLRKKLVLSTIAYKRTIPSPYLDKYLELAILKDVLDKLAIDCVLDVGANVGQFAQDLRLIGYTGRIISFEPVASVFQELCRRMNDDKNWQGFNFALGSVNGNQIINVGTDSKLSSILVATSHIDSTLQEKIIVKRLDDIWESLDINQNHTRVFLKMDTQGYDLHVFRGAEKVINKVYGLMSEISVIPLYEHMIDYKESLTVYESTGFSLCGLGTVLRDANSRVIELNCIMRR